MNLSPHRRILQSLYALALATCSATSLATELDFYQDIYPFLKTNCISCHNKTTTKADLDMETPEMMKKGGESGPGLVPGKSTESLIVLASLHQEDMEMPPANNKSGAVNLSPREIDLLKQWIDQGAKSSVLKERSVTWQPLAAGVHPIYSVAMTRDGRFAACGRSNQIFIYDLATRQFITRITDETQKSGTAHRALVQSLAFSPDGTRLASGSFREVKIWRLQTSAPAGHAAPSSSAPQADEALLKKVTAAAKMPVLSHALSGDQKLLAAGCGDGSVRVWETATLKPVITLTGSVTQAKTLAALDWTIAQQTLEQAFQKAEAIRIETQNKALDELLKKAQEAIVAMKKVLPEKQKAVPPTTAAKVTAQKAVDEIAAKIATPPAGQTAASLPPQLKAAQEKLQAATMAETSALAGVTAAESNVKDAEEEVKRITEAKAQNAKDLAAANASMEAAKKIQDKATADLTSAKQAIAKSTVKPLAVAFSADQQRIALVGSDGHLQVFGLASGMAMEEIAGTPTATASLTALTDGTFFATLADGKTLTSAGAPRWVLERTLGGDQQPGLFVDRINAVRFSPDGKTLATGGGELSRSGDIHLFDVASGKTRQTWKDRHEDAVLSLDFSPDGKRLASGASDKLAKVTEVATGKQMNLFEGHTHHVMGVAFRADGRILATAGADGVVMAWDMILGERKKKIEGWTKEVTSLQFIGASRQILTSAGDNLVRIVNDDGTQVRSMANLPDFMQAIASTPAGTTVIGGGEDSYLRIWDGTGKELAAFGDN